MKGEGDMSKALPQNIRRYHVFLASPGCVEEHRKFVRSFFGDYNIQHAAEASRGFRHKALAGVERWPSILPC